MTNPGNTNTPAPFKNDILANMIQKFSEEAKKQFELSAFSKKDPFSKENNDPKTEDNKLLEESAKYFLKNESHQFNKIVSLTDFKQKKITMLHNINKNGKEKEPNLERLIHKNKENYFLSNLLKNLSLTKWMNIYQRLISPDIQSIEEMINKLQNYSFEAPKATLCEVKEVTVLDCIQIITVKDIRLVQKKIILTNNTGNYESVGDLINDYYLKEGDVFMCKNKINSTSDFIRLNINDIQK